ncbi:MAG: ion transporter [Pseudomonadota bacterium]
MTTPVDKPHGKLEAWKNKTNTVIFGYRTDQGRHFDIALIAVIVLSLVVVLLDSVASIHAEYGQWLYWAEWGFTLLFTVEYALRIWSSEHRRQYLTSFFGVVDLLSILPTYLSLLIPGSNYLLTIRALRMLRIFKILQLSGFDKDAGILMDALRESRRGIVIFLYSVGTLTVLYGTMMYIVEGPENGFTSIPTSIYWAIVTLTTVGYGDISPQTPLGQAMASLIMVTGYAIIAVPTGIFASAMTNQRSKSLALKCPRHPAQNHERESSYCRFCGEPLQESEGS